MTTADWCGCNVAVSPLGVPQEEPSPAAFQRPRHSSARCPAGDGQPERLLGRLLLVSRDGRDGSLASDLLVDLRPPWLVLVREPHQLRVESADESLAFGARLVELPGEDGCVTGNDDRAAARLDDDHL